jgi:hypothetical protein
VNILYLIKTIESTKLSDLVSAIDAPPLDMDLAIWDSIDRGEIEVDGQKDRVKVLKEDYEMWHDPDLATKLLRVVQHYAANGSNVTRGRMDGEVKDPSGNGYPWHEYLMTRQYLVDTGVVEEEVISVPKTKKRPFHRFVFMGLPGNDNAEMNAKAVNKWLAQWESSKVK